ncbi:PIF1-like helicase [Popillia japonica]|uniref:ATP-dependent DNA helicase n=1 Tax=Popillia japonica TaxID=7064 RepID=A0AAW1HT92_POPJA
MCKLYNNTIQYSGETCASYTTTQLSYVSSDADSTCTVSSPKRIECVCDQPGPATKRCPLHEVVEIGDEITLPDAAIERHILNECICYEPGPAHRMCPLHEMDAFDANQEIESEEAIQQRIDNAGEINVNRAIIELIENELRNPKKRFNRELIMQGKSILSDFDIDDPPEEINMMDDRIDIDEERQEANIMVNQLNEDQRNIFDMIIKAINNENEQQRLFYVSGSGGVGKSFLYNTIITHLNASEIKVISIASTGIAAALLKQGRTVHSRFQLPVPSGFPQHTLKLKQGCIIMLLRNLNVRANLCNGTRLLVHHLGELYIDAEIIQFNGQLILTRK